MRAIQWHIACTYFAIHETSRSRLYGGSHKSFNELAIERIVSMKIAQISPLWESVPPRLYGGTERVVSYITEELVRQGHEVTLFASGDSSTTADLRAACPHALRLNTGLVNRDAPLILMQEQVFGAEADRFDVIHSHLDLDRKSTRLNSSHLGISYAVFCLKKKNIMTYLLIT